MLARSTHHRKGWAGARFSRMYRKQFVIVKNTEAMMLRQDSTVRIGHPPIILDQAPQRSTAGSSFVSINSQILADESPTLGAMAVNVAPRDGVGSFVLPCRGVQDEGLYSRHCTPAIAYGLRHFP